MKEAGAGREAPSFRSFRESGKANAAIRAERRAPGPRQSYKI